METIFVEFMQKVEEGQRFKINFEKRNLKIGKKYLIKNGNYAGRILATDSDEFLCPLKTIEEYYHTYKKSLPSERSEKQKSSRYFKALDFEELSDEEIMTGEKREVAQARLEGFLLIAILKGWTWKKEYGNWFWRSLKDKDLIILRKWLEGEKGNE